MIIKKFSIATEHKIILLVLLLGLFVFGGKFILADLTNSYDNIFERTETLEVWANTYIEAEIYDAYIRAYLKLDNSSTLSDSELIFYINNVIFNQSFTNSEGFVDFYFGSEHFNSETEGFLFFEGNPSLYLNSSSLTFKLNNSFEELNETLNQTNQTNMTLENISLEGFVCKDFADSILWSSEYTHNVEGIEKYYIWNIKKICEEEGREFCFIQDVILEVRGLYSGPSEEGQIGEGYVKIANPNNSICENPESGIYSRYLAYESITEIDTQKREWLCGKDKNPSAVCGIEGSKEFLQSVDCYGIKIFSSQYFILDVVNIKYRLCWGEENV